MKNKIEPTKENVEALLAKLIEVGWLNGDIRSKGMAITLTNQGWFKDVESIWSWFGSKTKSEVLCEPDKAAIQEQWTGLQWSLSSYLMGERRNKQLKEWGVGK